MEEREDAYTTPGCLPSLETPQFVYFYKHAGRSIKYILIFDITANINLNGQKLIRTFEDRKNNYGFR